jgi:hypothetical protein
MPGIPDTLIEINPDVPQAEELAKVEREICALYPAEAAKPQFRFAHVVERDGRTFVRLSTMAGSLHFWIRRGAELGTFPRTVLAARDKDLGEYEYIR